MAGLIVFPTSVGGAVPAYVAPTARPFPTFKGEFFDRWNDVWGQPDRPFEQWGADRDIFVAWYASKVNPPAKPTISYISTSPTSVALWNKYNNDLALWNASKYNAFELLDTTIRDTVNLDGENTVTVRNALAGLIKNASKRAFAPSHTDALFGLHYYRWENVLMPLMRRHYPYYNFYVEYFQEKVIVPYWDARTAAETEQRNNLIKNIALTVAAGVLAIVTVGLTTAVVSQTAAKLVDVTTGIKVDPGIIQSGLDQVTASPVTVTPGNIFTTIGNAATTAVNEAGKALSRIDLDPTHANIPISLTPGDTVTKALDAITQAGASLPRNIAAAEEKAGGINVPPDENKTAGEDLTPWILGALGLGALLL